MKKIRITLAALCFLSATIPLSGCWNYREADKMGIVSGIAIDKEGATYFMTTEVVDFEMGKERRVGTKIITSEGETFFDAARKSIKTIGNRLYFSHAKILVISREIAEEGIVPIIDWVSRDAETRFTLQFLVSKESTARDILEKPAGEAEILSYELNNMLRAQSSLSFAYVRQEYQFLQELAAEGISATLPTVYLKPDGEQPVAEISGTAVFSEDRLVGFLDGEETKTLMFIKNKIKGGLLAGSVNADSADTKISLEILRNKTKIKPRQTESGITIDIRTKTNVALDEIGGSANLLNKEGLADIKETFEAGLEENIRSLVKKTQEEYGSDIFGFGKAVKMSMPGLWKQLGPEWNEIFKTVQIDVQAEISIKNSAIMSKPVKVGD
jgi:spore germination protein KC